MRNPHLEVFYDLNAICLLNVTGLGTFWTRLKREVFTVLIGYGMRRSSRLRRGYSSSMFIQMAIREKIEKEDFSGIIMPFVIYWQYHQKLVRTSCYKQQLALDLLKHQQTSYHS